MSSTNDNRNVGRVIVFRRDGEEMIGEAIRLDGGEEMVGQRESLRVFPIIWNIRLIELRIGYVNRLAIDVLNCAALFREFVEFSVIIRG